MDGVNTTIEELAAQTVNDAFKLNKDYHKTFHDRQHRHYNMVLNKVDPDRVIEEGRSDIKTGVPHMLHEIGHSVLKDSLTSNVNVGRIRSPLNNKELVNQAEMDDYLHYLFTDEISNVKRSADDDIWDLMATGNGVLCPGWHKLRKRMFKEIEPYIDENGELHSGREEFDVMVAQHPAFALYAPWDVFPTAGATSVEQCHEIIYRREVFPHELRDWERQGFIKNVNELLDKVKEKPKVSSPATESRKPDDETDAPEHGKIEILIYWGLFPLYKYKKYIGHDGLDRSADEVQCLVIKAKDYDTILELGRNPFDHQSIPCIVGKYFEVPGQFWGESIFSIIEKMLIHQEDWFNIIQDAANAEVGRDMIFPDNVDEGEAAGGGVSRRYHVTAEDMVDGAIPKYMERGPTVLPETYNQRDYLDRIIQEVSGIVDLIRGVQIGPEKTATEVIQIAERINARFKQRALTIERTLLQPLFNWMVALIVQFGDDEEIKELTGLDSNPFKQLDTMMPSRKYRIKLEGAIKAAENVANRQTLQLLLTMSANIQEPMPDENGMLFKMNTQLLLYDLGRMSPLTDPDRYKLPIDPEAPTAIEAVS